MKLMDVPASELLSPDVLPSDFEASGRAAASSWGQAALEKARPSVSPADLKDHQARMPCSLGGAA